MQILYTHHIAVDLGGTAGHVWPGRTVEVPDDQGQRLIRWGHATEAPDPVEPVRHAPAPSRRTR